MKIKLGKRYKPDETIPAGEIVFQKYQDGSWCLLNLKHDRYVSVQTYYRAPEIKFVLPVEPKAGEVWETKFLNKPSRVLRVSKYGNHLESVDGEGLICGVSTPGLKFIRRWEPCDED